MRSLVRRYARNSRSVEITSCEREVQGVPNSSNNDSEMVSSAEFCGNFLPRQELKIETRVGELFGGENWRKLSLANQQSRNEILFKLSVQ